MERVEDKPFLVPRDRLPFIAEQTERFDRITEHFPVERGNGLSKEDRDRREGKEITLTYGEISFSSMAEVFESIRGRYGGLPEGGVFYDLGSGTGKGVLAAALMHNFAVCRGVEILEGLYQASLAIKSIYEAEMEAAGAPQCPRLEFVLGDLFDTDWTQADCIFANSTCFSNEMMDRIAQVRPKPGCKAITFTKYLKAPHWRILERVQKDMSWGIATIFIHESV